MMTLRALLAFALAFLPLADASAGTSTITTKDAAGATKTFVVTTDGSSQFIAQSVICDGTAAAQCAAVKAASTAAAQTDPALVTRSADIGTTTDSTCAGDTTSGCTQQARLQRIAERISSVVTNTGTIATNTGAGTAATGAAVPASAIYNGVNVSGTLRGATAVNPTGSVYALQIDQASRNGTALVADPCQTVAKNYTPFSVNTATTTAITTATASNKVYVCHISLQATGGAQTIGVVEGTGGSCASPAAVWGGSGASTGFSFQQYGGIALGNGAYAVLKTPTADRDLCLITGSAVQTSGVVVWVKSTL